MSILSVGRIKFYRIPDYFLERYDAEFVKWANEIKRGTFQSRRLFVFREGAFAADSPDPEQGKELVGAWLFCRISRKAVEIEPFTKADEDRIRVHCTRMMLRGVPARAQLVEPPRPGIPTLPSFGNAV